MRPGSRLERIIRIKDIEKEYRVAVIARDVLAERLAREPSMLTEKGLEQVHFNRFRNNLEPTYLIRIFAEFETGLRDYWRRSPGKRSNPKVSDMIRSVGSTRKIDFRETSDVDAVRKYRNKLVHEEDSSTASVGIGEARKSLCIFFGRLPEDW